MKTAIFSGELQVKFPESSFRVGNAFIQCVGNVMNEIVEQYSRYSEQWFAELYVVHRLGRNNPIRMSCRRWRAPAIFGRAISGRGSPGLRVAASSNNRLSPVGFEKQYFEMLTTVQEFRGDSKGIVKKMRHRQDPHIINFGQGNPVYALP